MNSGTCFFFPLQPEPSLKYYFEVFAERPRICVGQIIISTAILFLK